MDTNSQTTLLRACTEIETIGTLAGTYKVATPCGPACIGGKDDALGLVLSGPDDTFMVSRIQIDFDVDLTGTCGESALFGALRKGGCERGLPDHPGKVTAEIAKAFAESEFEKYRIVQNRLFESDFDQMLKQLPNAGDQP